MAVLTRIGRLLEAVDDPALCPDVREEGLQNYLCKIVTAFHDRISEIRQTQRVKLGKEHDPWRTT
jgi:hypothetical protein